MTDSNYIELEQQLLTLGFASVINDVDKYSTSNQSSFTIYHSVKINDDQLMYALQFEKAADNTIRFIQYELTLKSVIISDVTIAWINTKELESRLEKALYDQYLSGNVNMTSII